MKKTQQDSPPRELENIPNPEPPPENSSATSRVTRSTNVQHAQQVPATMHENTQTDGRATTIMSQEVPEMPPIKDRELGVTIAPSMPNIESMPHQQDENTDTETGETIEHARDSWPKESPKTPTREPPRTSEHACQQSTQTKNSIWS